MPFGISPTGGASPYYQPPEHSDRWLIDTMNYFMTELRNEMGPPPHIMQLETLLPEMEAFLEKNKGAIYAFLQKMGYPTSGDFSVTNEFDTALKVIKTFLSDPKHTSVDLLNEAITQLHFYCTHSNKSPLG